MMLARRDTSRYSNDCLSSPVVMTSITFPLIDAGPASGFSLNISTSNTMFNSMSGVLASDVCTPANALSIEAESLFLFCPDPATGACRLENEGNLRISGFQLFDAGSKLVWERSMVSNAEKIQIDIPALSKGIYFLLIHTTAGPVRRKLLVSR